jgi:opacity protein-like surface antigen
MRLFPTLSIMKNSPTLNRILEGACRSSARNIVTILFCFILCATPASAQSAFTTGRSKSFDVSLGSSYMSHENSQSNRIGLIGADASFTLGLYPRVGIRADLAYARAANVLGTPSHSDVVSYMVGPVFHPATQRRFDTYIHVLLGGARVTGPVPINGGFLLGGWTTGYAWAVGGGVEYRVSDSMAVRTGVDYMRTTFYGPSLTIEGQNNIRTTVSVVYLFGTQSRRRR